MICSIVVLMEKYLQEGKQLLLAVITKTVFIQLQS